jgi:hypothetical protein
LWWWLLACASAPQVAGVDPSSAKPGDMVRVLGDGFGPGATVTLVSGDLRVPLEGPTPQGVVAVDGKLPVDLAPGVYTVEVAVDGRVGASASTLTVELPPVEVPCAGDYQANTQLSLARGLIVIDRFFQRGPRNGERETLRLEISSLSGVEYELVRMDDQRLCSVIFVKGKDGRRYMFDDDTEVDLKDRAYRLGREIGAPVTVTREDATEMGKPVERD